MRENCITERKICNREKYVTEKNLPREEINHIIYTSFKNSKFIHLILF